VDVKAEGAGSRIELDLLVSFTDIYGTTTNGDGLYSSLTVSNGGTVNAPQLAQIRGVNLMLDGTGMFPTAQITYIWHGRMVLSGIDHDFTNLVDLTDTDVIVDGIAPQFGSVTAIDGTDRLVRNGGILELPMVTSYAHASTSNSQTRTLRAEGAGSLLDLGNVQTVTNGTHYNSRLVIEAISGGQIDLGDTVEITEPNSGDLRYRRGCRAADSGGYSGRDD
jgi:hypothetical protein